MTNCRALSHVSCDSTPPLFGFLPRPTAGRTALLTTLVAGALEVGSNCRCEDTFFTKAAACAMCGFLGAGQIGVADVYIWVKAMCA